MRLKLNLLKIIKKIKISLQMILFYNILFNKKNHRIKNNLIIRILWKMNLIIFLKNKILLKKNFLIYHKNNYHIFILIHIKIRILGTKILFYNHKNKI